MNGERLVQSSRISVSQLVLNGKKMYRVVEWTDDNDVHEENLFRIRLVDQDTCWEGKFSKESAEQFSKDCYESRDLYHMRARECLTLVDQGNFKYDFVYNNDDTAVFIWKRPCDGDSTIFVVHGQITLLRDPNSNRDKLIELLIEENSKLQSTASKLDARNHEINEELGKCKQELDQLITAKNNLESKLYGRFVTLMNAKKARIKLLEEHINMFDSN